MLYECGVRYERTMENGMTKKVTELYLVDALSFAEAEGRITNEVEPYISGEFDVVTIKRTNISEIVEGLSTADKWFKAKLMYITIDEKTGKEKLPISSIPTARQGRPLSRTRKAFALKSISSSGNSCSTFMASA